MIKLCIMLFSALLLFGCSSSTGEDDLRKRVDVFRGLYLSNNQVGNIGTRETDSILFSMEDNGSYTILFFEAVGKDIQFCSHTGTVSGFWTNLLLFSPEIIEYNNCDTVNLPNGYFVGDYVNHGDTIVLEQLNGTILKRITLIQQK